MKYYELIIYDNDSYLLQVSKVDRDRYIHCDSCKMIQNKRNLIDSHLLTFKLKRKKYQISGTYDGFFVVSQHFKDLYEQLKWSGVKFYSLPKSNGFYIVECLNIVNINKTMRPVEFEDKCSTCGNYLGTYGNIPCYIDIADMKKMKANCFYRSDLEFGYDFEQVYSLFVSEEILNVLKQNKLVKEKDFLEVQVVE